MTSNFTQPFQNAQLPSTNLTLITPKSEIIDEPPPPPPQQQHLSAASPPPSSSGADVFSEFNRISELFQTAFAQGNGDAAAVPIPESDPDSRAIVLVPEPKQEPTDVAVSAAPSAGRKYATRSSELVRVTDLKPIDQSYFRDLIRRTRMLFDSLSLFAITEELKQADPLVFHRKPRGDLRASALMRQAGLWLNRDKRVVGDMPGLSIGDVFVCRMELCVVGLHGQPQAGIDYVPTSQSSNGEPIATSVIVSGGYEDDEDSGDVIVYTGHGGQDKNHNKQVVHQKLECGNLAMERSMNYGIEVRVIRGFKCNGSSTGKIYVYDGLYRIVETWFDVGKSGFGVFKFKLVRIENQVEMGSTVMKFAENLKTRPLEVRSEGYVTLDLSKKKENLPVYFYNDIDGDHDPIHYDYLVTTVFPPYVYNSGTSSGCECVDGCRDSCFCAMKNGGEFAYDMHGNLLRGKPLIFECGPHCRCPPSCRNRVSQKGVRYRFEVFRSRETGWGLRSLDMIQAGSFICEYTGVVLTNEQAQIFTMNGDGLIYPRRFGERWKEWGDLSQIFSDYVCPSHPQTPPLDFAIDVSRMRNVACYMSHSPSPNVFVQHVLFDHNNVSFPHLMLFAMENIPPMRELSLDYGVSDEWMGKLAICH